LLFGLTTAAPVFNKLWDREQLDIATKLNYGIPLNPADYQLQNAINPTPKKGGINELIIAGLVGAGAVILLKIILR
jgi:hypothetical protein